MVKSMNRRIFLSRSTRAATLAGMSGGFVAASIAAPASSSGKPKEPTSRRAAAPAAPMHDEILGQGAFRYRVDRFWGLLDPAEHPVKDCHGVVEDRSGRIIVLTNDVRNNLIAYTRAGKFLSAWENRFPAAHGLEISLQ